MSKLKQDIQALRLRARRYKDDNIRQVDRARAIAECWQEVEGRLEAILDEHDSSEEDGATE